MRAAAPLVASVSAERVGDEFGKLMRREAPSVGLEILRETGVLAQLWPELLEGVGVDQNEWHAYDVYRHNLATLDASPPGDLALRLAALLHDVGKPRTVARREDGRGNTFYQHEHVGAEMVPAMLARLRLPRDRRDGRPPRPSPHVRRRPRRPGQDAAPLRAPDRRRASRPPVRAALGGHRRLRPAEARRLQRALRGAHRRGAGGAAGVHVARPGASRAPT